MAPVQAKVSADMGKLKQCGRREGQLQGRLIGEAAAAAVGQSAAVAEGRWTMTARVVVRGCGQSVSCERDDGWRLQLSADWPER